MGDRILKRLGVFCITVILFVAVIAPCLGLGGGEVQAASSYTYTSMVRKSVSISEDRKLEYYLVEPRNTGKYDVVILFSGLYGTGSYENTFLYNASKWVASKKIKPVVFVIPILEKYGSHRYFRDFVDEKINGKTKMEYLFGMIRDGSISGKANPKTDITVGGYSMGACAALYAGILYKDTVKNVGALSPSYRTYNGDDKGWIKDPEELVFTDDPGRHLFMCASKKEKKGSMYNNMQLYLKDFKTPFVTKTYSKGKHEMKLFQEEIFTFLYYVQHNQLPGSKVIKAMKKKKYYLSKRGRRYHGWHTIDGKKYYFNKKTGVMAKNKKIGKYYVGKDGARQ